jgi:hypothetical protein
MLRNLLLAVCLVLVAVGGGAWLAGSREFMPLFAWGSLVLLALLMERWRYRPKASVAARADAQNWQATGERFVDPDSGRLMQVYFHAKTGERRYEDVAAGSAESDRP